jgi:hypothetical protein
MTLPPSPIPPRSISLDSQEIATAYTIANHLLTGEVLNYSFHLLILFSGVSPARFELPFDSKIIEIAL